ncbi:MAG: SDR family NAD(P)-dependent oxidoreductase [Candidatus Thorarchaeota archaeon]
MKEKICLVTGANSGIGKATAFGLAEKGARVILVCRNKEKGETTIKEIIDQTGNNSIDLLIADFSSMKSVRKLAKDVEKKYSHLDVLILNAGAFFYKRQVTEDGFERTAAINYLSRFLLTNLLLKSLEKSDSARIIDIVGGMKKMIDFDDFMMEQKYSGSLAIARFSLANILFIHELNHRKDLNGTTANYYDPGAVRTKMAEKDGDIPKIIKFLFKLFKPFFKSPSKAAEMIIALALSDDFQNVTGKHYSGKKEEPPPSMVLDDSLRKRLWDISADLTKINN